MDLATTDSTLPDIHELQPLLKQDGVITVPKELSYESYCEVSWALSWVKHNSMNNKAILKFLGVGGDYTASTAIGEAARDNDTIGVLVGGSYSGHVMAFMMCEDRYVYPTAYIGIHGAWAMPSYVGYVALDHKFEYENKNLLDKMMAEIFSDACEDSQRYSMNFWLEKIRAPRTGVEVLSAHDITDVYKMAKPISDMDEDNRKRIGR